MPHLVQMAADHAPIGLQTLGVTDAPAARTREFMVEHGLPFPVLAEAARTREAYGVDLIWGSPVFLVDNAGRVVAEELHDVEQFLHDVSGGR